MRRAADTLSAPMTDCHTKVARLLARLVSVSGSVVIDGKNVKQSHSAGVGRSRRDQLAYDDSECACYALPDVHLRRRLEYSFNS